MFAKMKEVMTKKEYKNLTFSEKFISNIVVSMSGGWKLFKENSDKLDRLRENKDKSHAAAMKKIKEIKTTLSNIDSGMSKFDKKESAKLHFLSEDLRKILISLDKDKHLSEDQFFDVFEKKNITLDPNPNADKLTDQEIKKLVDELYELREK